MVLSQVATTIVPDEAAWAVWGHDLAGAGFVPAASPERATVLLIPDPLPEPLAAAARDAWGRMPGRRVLVPLPADLVGGPSSAVTEEPPGEHDGVDHGAMQMDHGAMEMEMDGGDMMAIVGDPSRDGLVMEDVAFRVGPLSPVLPGGLIVDLTLDGDLVTSARACATLAVPLPLAAAGRVPDPLAAAGWRAAFAGAQRRPWPGGIAAVEAERVRSHAAWLRSLGRALGATELRNLGAALLDPRQGAGAREALAVRAERALSGRLLRRRLGGLATVPQPLGLFGPNARAAGLPYDVRSGDARYTRLGFEPVVLDGGDAVSRCLVRVRELAHSLELCSRAGADEDHGPGTVEGPRGPLRAVSSRGALAVAAPGAATALDAACSAIAGLELGAATVALVSFDLSPWRVGP